MKKKHYSFLDQRRTDFDVDYEEFCQSTTELHVSYREKGIKRFIHTSTQLQPKDTLGFHCVFALQNQLKNFMDSTFEKIHNTERALNVLKKFER
jgi:dynein heavy chain